uniref:Uncharacterized protein n=1 Tax=Aegilops tauschii subsp. strangulata TaxID=200361 RepID=A0A453EXJ4_AEGTS
MQTPQAPSFGEASAHARRGRPVQQGAFAESAVVSGACVIACYMLLLRTCACLVGVCCVSCHAHLRCAG